MRKRLSSKVLAVILTLAICASTVLGCLMTVGAATSCYSFGEGKFNGDDLTQATIDVTFTAPASLPNGFVAGAFSFAEADADGADYLIFKDVTSANVNVAVEDNYVVFDSEDAVKTAKFTFTVGFSTGAATDKTYKVALGDVELAYNDAEYYTEADSTGKPGEITAACKHVIAVVGDPYKINEANDYSVYENSVCTKCGEGFGKQLVPTADADNLVYADGNNASIGTVDLLEFGSYLTDMGSESTYWDTVVADNGETGDSWENAIIIDTAEEFVYLCKGAGNDATKGKYYKVADGIAGFNLSTSALDLNGTLAENLATIQGSGKNHAGDTSVSFQGNFDGNGITVYGAVCSSGSYTGLFSCTKGDVTIKNLNVKLSSFTGTTAAAGIVGYHNGDGTNTLTIENCSVTDCYIKSTGTAWGCGVGAIVGHAANLSSWKEADKGVDGNGDGDTADTIYVNGKTNITNCYVNLDSTYFLSGSASGNAAVKGGVVGWHTSNGLTVDRCVVIGITPYGTNQSTTDNNVQHVGLALHFTNVYTTSDVAISSVTIGGTLPVQNFTGIYPIATLKGAAGVVNMPKLDWGTTWVMDGTDTYPRLAAPGEVSDTIYWDGTVATGFASGTGTKDDPIIISTASELAYLIGLKAETAGKYYKVADGIKNIVLQKYAYINEIKALDSAAAVKSYFEAGTFTEWVEKGWEQSSFCGTFDGNGATVYGLYMVSASNAGLFSTVDAGATIKNIAVKNSYIVSQSSGANYQVGAIAAVASSGDYGVKDAGAFWFNNCTVANCYMYNNCTGDRSGIIFGTANYDVACIDNCLVYGNDATYGDGLVMGLVSLCQSNLTAEGALIPEGLTIVTNGGYINAMVRNTIVLGSNVMNVNTSYSYRRNAPDCYVNVYTDGASGTVTFNGGGKFTYNDDQIKAITAADAQGSGAAAAMPNLAWGTDWYCGAEGKYPVQAVFATLGTSGVSSAELELVAHNTTYNENGSVDLNFHFVLKTTGATPVLYVGTFDGSKFMKVEATTSSQTATLGDNALMYVIPNLSARDIDLVWLPTLVSEGSAIKEWGKSEELALADNARAIIAGDYSTADKNVAAALLNYGNASDAALSIEEPDYNAGTIDLLEFGDYLTEAGSTSTYWDTNVADNGETGADWDNAIIIDSAEEFVYLCKASGNETSGKYYKVADGIAGFNLANNNLDIEGTLADNLEVIMSAGKNHSGGTPGFQGHFDGNGATVYGAWSNHNSVSTYAGLFTATFGEVTIKNIHVNKAHFTAKNAVGGIIGYHKADDMCTVTIENCSITDSYLETQGTGYGHAVGAIIGYGASAPSWKEADKGVDGNGDGDMVDTIYVNVAYNIKNCYVNLDEKYFVSAAEDGVESSGERVCHGGVAGILGSNALKVSECVVIGITPYATSESTAYNDVQHSGMETHFANVYTTAATGKINIAGTAAMQNRDFTDKVFQLTLEQMTGYAAKTNMPALDWNTTWTTTSGYPTFINKNYEAPASGYSIYWDGSSTKTAPSVGSGTKDDPYIISTVAELAYIFGQGRDNYAITLGNYYKLADGITSIVMQPEAYASDIMALGSAAEAKAYFEGNAANMKQWLYYGWEGSTFCGNIDFNGATIYGIYQVSSSNAGLISNVDAGAVVSNLSIKNSYMVSQSSGANYQAGAIAAVTNASSYGQKATGFIWFNNCIVANNYMYNNSTSHDRSGVIIGASSDIIYIDNCLTYGNDATYGDGVTMPVWSSATNSTLVSAAPTIPDGLEVETDGASTPRYRNKIRNSMIFGNYPYDPAQTVGSRFNDPNCYTNVYTDVSAVTTFFSNITETQISVVSADKALGAAAQTNMPNLDWSIWYVGATGDMPNLKPAGDMPMSAQTLYNGMVLDTMDDYGYSVTSFGMYAPGLNLKVNPYMTFTFEFGGEYQRNENVVVTFKSGDTVIETVTAADMVNNEDAGRFHLYRLKTAPVTALSTGISVSVSYNGGAAVDFGTYSAEGFALTAQNANKVEPCDYYATRYEAAKALLFYADMLAARYGA